MSLFPPKYNLVRVCLFRSFGISVPTKFVDNQVESEDESDLNIDLDMLQVPTLI